MHEIQARVPSTELLQISPNLAHFESLQLWVEDTKDASYWGPTNGTGKTSVLLSLGVSGYHRYPLTFLAWALLQGECKQ